MVKNQADFVALGRSLLSDPELPNKVKEGRLDDINYCTTCQGCQERLFSQLSSSLQLTRGAGVKRNLQ